MAPRLFTVSCIAALVQLLGLSIKAESYEPKPISITVQNEVNEVPDKKYGAFVKKGGILLGALKRLSLESDQDFTFTVSENDDYGYYLESINGVAGNNTEHTFWKILSVINGTETQTPVGVGCYLPQENEHIIFRFTKWS